MPYWPFPDNPSTGSSGGSGLSGTDRTQLDRLMNAVALGFMAPTDANNYQGLLDAIDYAAEKDELSLYVPPGQYHFTVPATGTAIFPAGFSLYGGGKVSTEFLLDPASLVGVSGTTRLFASYNSGCSFRDFKVNGQRSLVNSGNRTNYGFTMFNRAAADASNVLFENVEMSNNPGGVLETFCMQTSTSGRGFDFIGVDCYNNGGSGISINGYMHLEILNPGTSLCRDVNVLRCRGVGNLWQGITMYGARDVRITDFYGASNGSAEVFGGNGINMEWVDGVTINGGLVENNRGAGVGGFSWCNNVLITGLHSKNNNSGDYANWAEIAFRPGAYFTPIAGVLERLRIDGGRIQPKTTGTYRQHLYVQGAKTSGGVAINYPTTIDVLPKSVIISGHDVSAWSVASSSIDTSSIKSGDHFPWCVVDKNAMAGGPSVASPFAEWTLSNMTKAAYTGGGALGDESYTLTTTAVSSNSISTVSAKDVRRLRPGKYMTHVRYKNPDADASWVMRHLGANDATLGTGQYAVELNGGIHANTTWQDSFIYFTADEHTACVPCLNCVSLTSGVQLHVDFINIMPLGHGLNRQASFVIGGKKYVYGADRPVRGDYLVGDQHIDTGTQVVETCTVAGSDGVVNAGLTAATTNGSATCTLSADVIASGLRVGQWVLLEGAGVAAADLRTQIVAIFTSTGFSVIPSPSTTLAAADVSACAPTFA